MVRTSYMCPFFSLRPCPSKSLCTPRFEMYNFEKPQLIFSWSITAGEWVKDWRLANSSNHYDFIKNIHTNLMFGSEFWTHFRPASASVSRHWTQTCWIVSWMRRWRWCWTPPFSRRWRGTSSSSFALLFPEWVGSQFPQLWLKVRRFTEMLDVSVKSFVFIRSRNVSHRPSRGADTWCTKFDKRFIRILLPSGGWIR